MRKFRFLAWGLACATATLLAIETKTWVQSEASEFEKGTIKNLSVSSDGRIRLAPLFKEFYDPSVAYLWTVAADSKGNIYSGGSGGKLFMVDAQGKSKTLAELSGGDIYSIAINRKDEVFAAVSPDAKVYKISVTGTSELFYEPKEKYVWAMAFHSSGDLFVATGDRGKLHRVSPDGRGVVFFESEETHVRSLAFDKAGNAILGTEPGGLVIRVSPAGQGFVLYQAPRREVTALAVSKDGAIYAAGVGAKPSSVPPPTPAPTPRPEPVPVPTSAMGTTPVRTVSTAPPSLGSTSTTVAGSEIFRIEADGEPRRVWSHAQHVVYGLTFDDQNRLLAVTGNQGVVYRIESDHVYTRLRDAEPSQITSIVSAPAGKIFLATANPGKVYQLGPGIEPTGTLESDAFDATSFTYWGRLRHEGLANGGSITIEARSGNLDRLEKLWSLWAVVTDRIVAPPSRFLAWKATLKAAPDGRSPELSLVEAAYLAKNVAPVIEKIEVIPANYKFASSSTSLTSSSALTLPPIGQPRRSSPSSPSPDTGGSLTVNYDKGSMGARWRASDANGDTLHYKIEIRGTTEREWKLLSDQVREARYSWDATAFADGQYVLRVTADDAFDNYPGQALSAVITSDPFTIDNTPPAIQGLSTKIENGKIVVRFKATDAYSPLALAEYSINGGEWIAAEPTTKLTDSPAHEYLVTAEKSAGNEFTIAVRVTDANDNVVVDKAVIR